MVYKIAVRFSDLQIHLLLEFLIFIFLIGRLVIHKGLELTGAVFVIPVSKKEEYIIEEAYRPSNDNI